MADLNTKLGSSFLKFTTKNLVAIKSEEVKFYEKVKRAKLKSTRVNPNQDESASGEEEEHEEPPREPQIPQTNQVRPFRLGPSELLQKASTHLNGLKVKIGGNTPTTQENQPPIKKETPKTTDGLDPIALFNLNLSKKLEEAREFDKEIELNISARTQRAKSTLSQHDKIDIEHLQIARTQFSDDEDGAR